MILGERGPVPMGTNGILLGRYARKIVTKGSVVMALQYVNGEPALCFWRKAAVNSPMLMKNSGAFIVCLSAAWRYVDSQYLVFSCARGAQVMGFGPSDRFATKEVADLLMQHLEDLVKMKPEPTEAETRMDVEDVKVDGRSVFVQLAEA